MVMKLFLDFGRLLVSGWLQSRCLESFDCLVFSFLAMASWQMLGGAMLASLYKAGRGVALRVPVINWQALLSSASTFVA